MLGVLKRRLKPKRAAGNINNNKSGNRLSGKGLEADPPADKHRAPTSPRQIHPVCEEKLQLVAYEGELPGSGSVLQPGGVPPYPLTPNICVEGGRIEFIKAPPECTLNEFTKTPLDSVVTPPAATPAEKTDVAKECLEARVRELEAALEAERNVSQRERLQTTKLQRQLARREVLQRDVDRERRLRLDSECRLRNSATEAERCRARLTALQREFSRMEDSVRSMLQYKTRYDQLKQDKHQLTVAYENRVQQFHNALSKLHRENEELKKQLHSLEVAGAGEVQAALVERLRVLEQDNSSLVREGEATRRQYERCLDDVANQVVRALLAQKGLREEISTLQQRVRELELQNRSLTSLLLQQLTAASEPSRPKPSIKLALPAPVAVTRPISCDDSRLRSHVWEQSVIWLPLQRPSSLSLETCAQLPTQHGPQHARSKEEDEGSESPESGNRDEGYSTMSSDVQGLTEVPRAGLEELKEASDETDMAPLPLDSATSSPDRLPAPDMVLIPLSVALTVSGPTNRHSFPPVKELLPFQHIVRSFSDSQLCLQLGPSVPSSLASAESLLPLPLRCNTLPTDDQDDSGSWCSADWWDADYVQHWLRLDDTRSALQQQLEYDAAELEDWSMEEEGWRPSLPHSQTLPSIQEQESSGAELDEECSWPCSAWADSWSTHSGGSKRSSAALSLVDDTSELPAVALGTDFTRDFYRLVKFESTKSLASTSSRSQAGESVGLRKGDIPMSIPLSSDREQALQSVLHFIAEQQQYVLSREVTDIRPTDVRLQEMSPEYCEESPSKETFQQIAFISEEVKQRTYVENERPNILNNVEKLNSENMFNVNNELCPVKSGDNALRLGELSKTNSVVLTVTEKGTASPDKMPNVPLLGQQSSYEIHVPLDKPKFLPEYLEESSVKGFNDNFKTADGLLDQNEHSVLLGRALRVDINRPVLRPVPEEDEDPTTMLDSFTSTISTPETILRAQSLSSSDADPSSSLANSTDSTTAFCADEPVLVNGPKIISFHERATSKDVINELNRIIRKGEDSVEAETTNVRTDLDVACCCPTGWVHVERNIDFTDPKARANLLDVMLAASHSSSSASSTSSSSSSSTSSANNSDSGEEQPDYQHLHRLHRFRRQKKASATREPLGALRCAAVAPRPSIIGRDDFFVRYGEKEREAVASFDFLEELSTTSSCEQGPGPRVSSPYTDDDHRHLSLSDSCAASFSGSEPSLDTATSVL